MDEHAIADVLKPAVIAPGVGIWSAWSPLPSTNEPFFEGKDSYSEI